MVHWGLSWQKTKKEKKRIDLMMWFIGDLIVVLIPENNQ